MEKFIVRGVDEAHDLSISVTDRFGNESAALFSDLEAKLGGVR